MYTLQPGANYIPHISRSQMSQAPIAFNYRMDISSAITHRQ